MRIRRVVIANIKSISELDWKPTDPRAGWHVVLGNNGAGKSSFLRCVALAIIGPREIQGARLQWRTWLPPDTKEGDVSIEILPDGNYDQFSGKGRRGETRFVSAAVTIQTA